MTERKVPDPRQRAEKLSADRKKALVGREQSSNKTKLTGRGRLEAALLVSQLYEQAGHRNLSREEIEARIGAALEGRATRSFRLERWMMPRSIEQITDDVVRNYRDRHEPQRKECVYYVIVRVLSEILQCDPDIALLQLLERTGREALDALTGIPIDEIEPAAKLASLLQEWARTMGVKADIQSHLNKARKLNLGWSALKDPEAETVKNYDSLKNPQIWGGAIVPPFPAARIVTVPVMKFDGNFNIFATAEDYTTGTIVKGRFELDLDLFITVKPDGKSGFAAFLGKVWNHRLYLGASKEFPGFSGRGTGYGETEEFFELAEFSSNVVEITTSDGCKWFVEEGGGPSWEFDDSINSTFNSAFAGCRLNPGVEGFAAKAEVAPPLIFIDAGTIAGWLGEFDATASPINLAGCPPGARWCLGETRAEQAEQIESLRQSPAHMQVYAAIEPLGKTYDAIETWHRTASMARNLEESLHSGALERALGIWLEKFQASLDAHETEWIAKASHAEEALRRRWADELTATTGLHQRERISEA
jgi:hypothetical protein